MKTPRRVGRSLDHQLLLTSVAVILLFLVFVVLDFSLALDVFPSEADSTATQGERKKKLPSLFYPIITWLKKKYVLENGCCVCC